VGVKAVSLAKRSRSGLREGSMSVEWLRRHERRGEPEAREQTAARTAGPAGDASESAVAPRVCVSWGSVATRARYRSVTPGVEALAPSACTVPRHRHTAGYATIVLSGTFVEASFAGRFAARPGDVLVHGAFDCHANAAISPAGVRILRLPWIHPEVEGLFRVRDPEALVRLADRDVDVAMFALSRMLERVNDPRRTDWPEALAADLSRASPILLGAWARERSLAPETVSRGFRRAFGVSPQRFRLEARARAAWRRAVETPSSLTAIAHDLEFADLPHMSRSVSALTGHAPSAWREASDRVSLMAQLPASR
jgi:AraC-like DNA-binding protein